MGLSSARSWNSLGRFDGSFSADWRLRNPMCPVASSRSGFVPYTHEGILRTSAAIRCGHVFPSCQSAFTSTRFCSTKHSIMDVDNPCRLRTLSTVVSMQNGRITQFCFATLRQFPPCAYRARIWLFLDRLSEWLYEHNILTVDVVYSVRFCISHFYQICPCWVKSIFYNYRAHVFLLVYTAICIANIIHYGTSTLFAPLTWARTCQILEKGIIAYVRTTENGDGFTSSYLRWGTRIYSSLRGTT